LCFLEEKPPWKRNEQFQKNYAAVKTNFYGFSRFIGEKRRFEGFLRQTANFEGF